MLQCQMPDMLFKTCASLTKVIEKDAASYRLETRLLVNPQGPVVAAIHFNVSVQGTMIWSGLDRQTVGPSPAKCRT